MSLLFSPLDHLLSTKAKVRLLRALVRAPASSVRQLAREAGLTHVPALRALDELETAGAITREVAGRQHGFTINRSNEFVRDTIIPLFEAEGKRLDQTFAELATIMSHFGTRVLAAYIYGSAARGEDRPGSDLDLLVVTRSASSIENISDNLVHQLRNLGDRLGLRFSVVVLGATQIQNMRTSGHAFYGALARDARRVFGVDLGRIGQ